MDFLDPALEALTPSINNDPTEIEISTAPQKASQKRTISAQDVFPSQRLKRTRIQDREKRLPRNRFRKLQKL
ncbi:hypothetical protein PtA15_8A186 [Puccinia triticina]|uniref:BZIP domain-containing protein n=1 Tax=Puccinia triticina TaxID=208348 RepID=A0ABY7CX33_9BASI|nr:uncharacterized protein PtA15_8A186 [Puccinia triticina]WAQ87282.1 hypothetical protein PtA15_8A186 [Puccinia triticina]WAR57133.1 hypothetical protein PtB15_8B179 [Puccinia triticina]